MKSGPKGPVERFDEAQRRQGHALRVGRKNALPRSLAWQVVPATCLHSLTSKTLFCHHHGLVGKKGLGPSSVGGFRSGNPGDVAAPLAALPAASNRAGNACPCEASCVVQSTMDENELSMALERADRALQRIERALGNRQAGASRDEALRARVREVVEELDELIREVAA